MTDSEQWKPIPGYYGYEASDQGRIRSVDRVVSGRRMRGTVLKSKISNAGYALVHVTADEGERKTRTVHRLVLAAHVGPCPEGMETLHGPGGPLDNRLANLRYGTKPQNVRDTIDAGTWRPPPVTHECINFERCGNLVNSKGRRCRPCVETVGKQAAAMLNRGVNLEVVAGRFGYTGSDWVYSLAVEFGGYEGTKRAARLQRPSLSQRVTTTLRARIGRGDSL